MTSSSINFKPVMSANRAVFHASREIAPTYLLAENLSLGTICILDDKSGVANTLAAKLALASRQALASKNFSPIWEGILNLPRPALNSKNFDAVEYKKHCVELTKSWIEEYEKATNHKVLRADIHLDEGHIDEASGEVLLNAHAHIISDKTNEKGKVFIIDKKQMRALQTLTAEVTGLARGKSSHETGRKHIHHDAYKAIAKANSKELDKVKATRDRFQKLFAADTPLIDKLKEDIQTAESEVSKKAARIARLTELKEGYKLDRAKLKASGIATQKQYQALKIKHEADLAKIAQLENRVSELTGYTGKLEAAMVAAGERSQVLTDKLEAKTKEHDAFKAQLAAQAAHLIDTTDVAADPAPRTSQSNPLTPAPVVPLGPNARARLRADQMALEAARKAQEPPEQPELPTPSPAPVKSLVERLSESWAAMLDWIKGVGVHVPIDTSLNGTHFGPVKHLDNLHAVQHKGGGKYAIHRLADLDKVPGLDDPKMEIYYRDGKGTVEGKSGPGVQR